MVRCRNGNRLIAAAFLVVDERLQFADIKHRTRSGLPSYMDLACVVCKRMYAGCG